MDNRCCRRAARRARFRLRDHRQGERLARSRSFQTGDRSSGPHLPRTADPSLRPSASFASSSAALQVQHSQALLAVFAWRRVDRGGRDDTPARGLRRRAALARRALRVRRRARPWCVRTARRQGKVCAWLLSPIVVLVSRLPSRRRFVRSEEAARASRRATRARRARRACIAGGSSPPQSSRGFFTLQCSSLGFGVASFAPSPAVVLVSRLLSRRRSVRSEGAARASRRTTRARRTRRECIAGGSSPPHSRAAAHDAN